MVSEVSENSLITGRWSASHWRPWANRGECIYVGYQSDNCAVRCDNVSTRSLSSLLGELVTPICNHRFVLSFSRLIVEFCQTFQRISFSTASFIRNPRLFRESSQLVDRIGTLGSEKSTESLFLIRWRQSRIFMQAYMYLQESLTRRPLVPFNEVTEQRNSRSRRKTK